MQFYQKIDLPFPFSRIFYQFTFAFFEHHQYTFIHNCTVHTLYSFASLICWNVESILMNVTCFHNVEMFSSVHNIFSLSVCLRTVPPTQQRWPASKAFFAKGTRMYQIGVFYHLWVWLEEQIFGRSNYSKTNPYNPWHDELVDRNKIISNKVKLSLLNLIKFIYFG